MSRSFLDSVKATKARFKRWSRLRRQTIKTWWDIENAHIPPEIEVGDIYQRLKESLRMRTRIRYRGNLEVKAVMGYSNSITQHVRNHMSSEILMHFVHHYPKPPNTARDQVADLAIRADIRRWIASQIVLRRRRRTVDNAMIISGDTGFAQDIYLLQHYGHHTMVAYTIGESGLGADESWPWRVFLGLPPRVPERVAARRKSAKRERRRNRDTLGEGARELRRKERAEKFKNRIGGGAVEENPGAVFGKEEDGAKTLGTN